MYKYNETSEQSCDCRLLFPRILCIPRILHMDLSSHSGLIVCTLCIRMHVCSHTHTHTCTDTKWSSLTSCPIEKDGCNKELPWIVIQLFLYQAHWGLGWLEVGVQQVTMSLHLKSQLGHLTVFLAEVRALNKLLLALGWSFRGLLQR